MPNPMVQYSLYLFKENSCLIQLVYIICVPFGYQFYLLQRHCTHQSNCWDHIDIATTKSDMARNKWSDTIIHLDSATASQLKWVFISLYCWLCHRFKGTTPHPPGSNQYCVGFWSAHFLNTFCNLGVCLKRDCFCFLPHLISFFSDIATEGVPRCSVVWNENRTLIINLKYPQKSFGFPFFSVTLNQFCRWKDFHYLRQTHATPFSIPLYLPVLENNFLFLRTYTWPLKGIFIDFILIFLASLERALWRWPLASVYFHFSG